MVDTIEIVLGIVSFTIIVNLMIFVILLARSRLVSTGNVTVEINGDPEKTISVPAGGKLLQTLAEQNLFLSLFQILIIQNPFLGLIDIPLIKSISGDIFPLIIYIAN